MLNPLWGADWPQVRASWALDDTVTHLNHGSFGAVPAAAVTAQWRLRELMERDPDRWFRELPARVAQARRAIAEYCRVSPVALALVPNASAAVTVVLAALDAEPGSRIVYTDHTYGAVELAIGRACRRHRLVPHRVAVPLLAGEAEVLRLVEEALDERTCLVVIDQVSSATARCLPAAQISASCRSRGVPVLVDGAHAPGLFAEPLAGLDADFWVGNLHKWTCAPRGTGALVAAPAWRDRLGPPIASWGEELPYPERFDAQGTLDQTAWLAAPTSFGVLAALGEDRVRRHSSELVEYGQSVLAQVLGVEVPQIPQPAPSMRLVPLPTGTAAATTAQCHEHQARIARQAGCEVAITTWRGQGFLRLSAFAYNAPADYHRLAERLPALLR